MEKLREAVIKLASSNQKNPLSSSQIALIDQRLHDSFPHGLRLPSHPTYASMIIKAITELSDERGSSKDSISEHVKANCDDLPWAHNSMLSHHLNRLCDEGLIILIDFDRYTIPGFSQKTVPKKGKHAGMMKQKIRCQQNLKEYRVHPHGNASNERKLRSGRRRLVLQESEDELVGLDSCEEIGDEHEVVEGMEEDTGQEVVGVEGKEEDNQEAQESEVLGKGDDVEKQKRLSPKQSISEMVKIRHRKTERKCDQLVTVVVEEKSLVDKCQDKIRSEALALEDGGILMNNGASFETPVKTVKNNGEKLKFYFRKRERKCDKLLSGGSDEKSLVDECQDKTRSETLALEDDNNGGDLMNNDASFEIPLSKGKKDAEEVKIHRSNRGRNCDQLVTVGTEEKSLVDECQDNIRSKVLALEDDNNGSDWMNNDTSFVTALKKRKQDAEKVNIRRSNRGRKCDQMVNVGTKEQSVGDECQDKTRNETLALEDDNNEGDLMNNGTSVETPRKKSLVDECQDNIRSKVLALDDDNNGGDLVNNDTSFVTALKTRKQDAEKVNILRSNRGRKCDQLVNVGTQEQSMGDECQDKTRDETLALEDDNNEDDLMNNGTSVETPRKKSLVDECQDNIRNKVLALEDDSNGGDLMNNDTSFVTPLKKRKQDAEKVNIRRSNRGRKCDQLVNVGTEEQSVGDECQDKTRNETLALEDDNNEGDLINNGTSVETPRKKRKKDGEEVKIRRSNRERKCGQLVNVGTNEQSVGVECQDKTRNETLALEDDNNGGDLMNNDMSVETLLKKKKKDAEKATIRRSNRERKCDALFTVGTEEKSVRDETLALKDNNNGGDVMNNIMSSVTPLKKRRKVAEKVNNCSSKRGRKCELLIGGGDEEKYLVDECLDKTQNEILAFGDDSNDSGMTKKRSEKWTGPVVCGIATKLPKLIEERRVTRQLSKCKEQPNKLIISPVNSFPSSKLQEYDNQEEASKSPEPVEPERRCTRRSSKSKEHLNKLIISPFNPLPSSKRQKRRNQQAASKSPTQVESEQCVTWKSSVSKEQPNKYIISPVNPLPSSKHPEHDDQTEASKSPKPVQRVTRKASVPKEQPNKFIISPVTPLPSSKIQEHDNKPEASIQSIQENNWPSWVQSLLQTTFFGKCKVHANVENSLCKFCCLDCKNGALCSSCLISHKDHRVIQIKRAVSEDAIDISDIEMNVDTSGIHTYKLNSDTLIVLNRMIRSGHSFAGNVAPCFFCKRPIPNQFSFCSLNCKYEQWMADSAAPCKIK